MKFLSAETLNTNTRIEMGPVTFVPVEGGRGKRMFEVQCDVREIPVEETVAFPRKPKIVITDEFGHLGTEHRTWAHQRRGGFRK